MGDGFPVMVLGNGNNEDDDGGALPRDEEAEDEMMMRQNVIRDEISDHPIVVALQESQQSFIITDCALAGNPIIYASHAFLTLTGYSISRVLGRNCRFLQGPGTDPLIVSKIRHAVDHGQQISVRMLNYKQDGTTFYNHLIITPIHDKGTGKVINFVGVQCEVDNDDNNPNDPPFRMT